MRRALIAFATALLSLTAVSAAHAAALAYLDAAGSIVVARPDGTGVKTVVAFNSALTDRYTPPVVDDAGRIVYAEKKKGDRNGWVYQRDQDGTLLAGPWLFETPICGSIAPFRSAVQASGTFAAFTYIPGSSNCLGSVNTSASTRLVDADGPTLSGSVYGEYSSLYEPRFLRRPYERLAGLDGNTIELAPWPEDPTRRPWISLNDPAWDIDSFDIHPTQDVMIMEQSPAGVPDGGERRDFLLLSYTGTPPDTPITSICTFDGLVANGVNRARPRFSPDGSQIAWTGSEGIYVSPAPTNRGDGICTLSPKLVIPGGRDAEWARFDVTVPVDPSNPGGGGTTPPPTTGGGTTTSPTPTKLALAPVAKRTRAAFRSGLSLSIDAPAAGSVTATATVTAAVARRAGINRKARKPVTVASAKRTIKSAGTITLKLKPTAKAKSRASRLKGATVTIKVKLGQRTVTRKVKLS